MISSLIPLDIKLLQKSKLLEIQFNNGEKFVLSCEYLRVFSPCAQVKGHGQSKGKLVTNKKNVNVISIEPVGHYAVKLLFDDGHNTGIYSWETLYNLGSNYKKNWQLYLQRLENERASR